MLSKVPPLWMTSVVSPVSEHYPRGIQAWGGVAVCKMYRVLSLVVWPGPLGTNAYHTLETQVTGF